MIVRIMGEGQLTLEESRLPELNKLDEELLAEMEKGHLERDTFMTAEAAREFGIVDKVIEKARPIAAHLLEASPEPFVHALGAPVNPIAIK